MAEYTNPYSRSATDNPYRIKYNSSVLTEREAREIQERLDEVMKLVHSNITWMESDERIELREKLKIEKKLELRDPKVVFKENLEMERELYKIYGLENVLDQTDDVERLRELENGDVRPLYDEIEGLDDINERLQAMLDFAKLEQFRNDYGITGVVEKLNPENKLDLKIPNLKLGGINVKSDSENNQGPINGEFDPNESLVDRLIRRMNAGGLDNLRMEHQLATHLSSHIILNKVIVLNNDKKDSPAEHLALLADGVRCARSAAYKPLSSPSDDCHLKRFGGYDLDAISTAAAIGERKLSERIERDEYARLESIQRANDAAKQEMKPTLPNS